jgi:endonuclease-3
MDKLPFDLEVAIPRIREAVEPYPKAALFELAEDGHTTTFEQLAACIISIRTLDEVMLVTAKKLFWRARTAEQAAQLTPQEIDALIHDCAFHEAKSYQIHAIAKRTMEEYGGEVPCDFGVLTSFSGVGPKCANLVLGIACGKPSIGVDIHVHRVTNRWGYVSARTPEETMAKLEAKLPEKYWVEINRLLVPFGKHVCTGKLPKCSTCPVLEMCRQVGVEKHR